MDVIKDLLATSGSVFLMRIQEKKVFQISVPVLKINWIVFKNLISNINHELNLFEQTTEVHSVQFMAYFLLKYRIL